MNSTDLLFSDKKTWIKVCGFTDPENARECACFNPDAMGFIFFEKSPRNISPDTARQIIDILPQSILPVGVFVDNTYDQIMRIVDQSKLRGVQLHGNESPELADRLLENNLFVSKALFAKRKPFLNQAADFKMVSALLVEYGKGILPGGNAESWNYEVTCDMETVNPVILAGGLSPETITNALQKAQPAGVDVSSGVEKAYGIKDIDKVGLFIKRVRDFARC